MRQLFRPFCARPFRASSALPALLCAFALGGCRSTPQSEQSPPQDQPAPRPEQTATARATSGAEQRDAQPESAAPAEAAQSGAAQSATGLPATDKPASDKSDASQSPPPSAAGATADEHVQTLDRELDASYGEHDAMLRDQQASARADAAAIAAQRAEGGGGGAEEAETEQGSLYEGLPGFGAPPPQGEANGAEGKGETATAGRDGGTDSAGQAARGAAAGGQLGGATVPGDIPAGRDDDIVARQLREAAQMEKDPELRAKLWDEYRKYKNQQANR